MNKLIQRISHSLQNEKIAWFWLGIIAILTSILRWHGFASPLHTDICVYATIGKELLQGGQLYFTLFDNKPPGIYLLYTGMIWLAGDDPLVFHLFGLLFILGAQVILYLILKKITTNGFALLGALIWSVATLHIAIFANQPHTEVFINFFLLLGLLGMVVWQQGGRRGIWLAGMGFGLASVLKTNVLFVYLMMVALWSVYTLRMIDKNNRHWVDNALGFIIPPMVLWLSIGGYFLFTGTFPEFIDIVFKSLSAYAGHLWINQLKFFFVWHTHPPIYNHFYLVLCFTSMVWLVWKVIQRRLTWLEITQIVYLFGCMLMTGSLQGLYLIYFQTFLPSLTILTVLFFSEGYKKRLKCFNGLLLIFIGVQIFYGGYFLHKSPDEISFKQYEKRLIIDRKLGQYLNSITSEGDRIYQWGLNAQLYYYAKRQPPVGLIQNHLLEFSPDKVRFKLKNKTFDTLMKSPPQIIIFTAWIGDFRSNMFYQALWPHYQYFGCYDKYLIFIRKDFVFSKGQNNVLLNELKTPSTNLLKTAQLQLAEESRRLYQTGKLITGNETRDLIQFIGNDRYNRLMREGNEYAKKQDWTKAMETWVAANDLKQKDPRTFANLGIYHESIGSFYRALEHYEIAYKDLGEPWGRYYHSAQRRMIYSIHQLENQGPKVPKLQRELMEPKGNDRYAEYVRQGNESARQVRWEKAKQYWDKAIKLEPKKHPAKANLAIYYEIHYRFQPALETYRILADQLGEPWRTYHKQVELLMRKLPNNPDSALPMK